MDNHYVGIMLVVFLVVAALAVNIDYMYVNEDDLHSTAETSALAGAREIKSRIMEQIRTDAAKLKNITDDTVQSAARGVAVNHTLGKHKEAALIHALNNNTNNLTTSNDVTVGFWNASTHTYNPGGKPVNAMQVRTRRTSESESVGIGNIGNILGILTGVQKFNYTPDAIAALPARANANFAVCADACGSDCTFPTICPIPERKMVSEPSGPGTSGSDRYATTSLTNQIGPAIKLSDMICMEMPPQEVCGKQILTILDSRQQALADMESMMYNPNVDVSNKEYDKATGELKGWWVIAPVTDCPPARQDGNFESHTVTKYALIRINRICAPGATGCKQNNTAFDSPKSICGNDKGLYIDRISCVNCGSRAMLALPGLHPVLVK
ncbi:MAG TPA: Tad domain-containing protein [Geobacteraceae bacterium]|nr:Tad domain-containing protein [Geobacteraceae bacterium]